MSERIGRHLLAEELSARDHKRRFVIWDEFGLMFGTVRYWRGGRKYVLRMALPTEHDHESLGDLAEFLRRLGLE